MKELEKGVSIPFLSAKRNSIRYDWGLFLYSFKTYWSVHQNSPTIANKRDPTIYNYI